MNSKYIMFFLFKKVLKTICFGLQTLSKSSFKMDSEYFNVKGFGSDQNPIL